MQWLTNIWIALISLALTLSGVYLARFAGRRDWLSFLFVLLGLSIAGIAVAEIWMFRATSIEEYSEVLRWYHLPIFVSVCSVVGIIHLRFHSDRLWLGLLVCGLRFVSVIINFAAELNLNYATLTVIDSMTILGEAVTIVEGEPSRWMLTGQVSLFLLLVYILDAAISTWRREHSPRAMIFCGTLAILVISGTLHATLKFWEIVSTPMLIAPYFIGIALVIGVEAGMEMLRAQQLDEALKESKTRLEVVSQTAAISELSGALAHEMNQPLGIILSNAEAASIMLEGEHPDIAELRDIIGDIISADQRAADVIVRLRSLLQRGEPNLQDSDLNGIVIEAIGHLRNDFRAAGISLSTELDDNLPLVKADWILLVQVLLNLLGNARDAVSQNRKGNRFIKIVTARNEQELLVTVEDNGVGLPEDTEQIFDAFVTTKDKGLGMGLAIAKTIVEAHDGRIRARARTGRGALLELSIPRKHPG